MTALDPNNPPEELKELINTLERLPQKRLEFLVDTLCELLYDHLTAREGITDEEVVILTKEFITFLLSVNKSIEDFIYTFQEKIG